ncbi:MAG: hypothetical protein COA33_009460 [Fluviicola sp.]|nr:hypothetical protein [Fluviicola sp.]
MKFIFIVLISCIFIFVGYSQNNAKWQDTLFHDNGHLSSIRTMSLINGDSVENGLVVDFNFEGQKIRESNFIPGSSVPCYDCYDMASGEWVQYHTSKLKYHSIQVGKMTTYYPNGQIRSTGNILGVHEYQGYDCVTDSAFFSTLCSVMIAQSTILDGIWNYYCEDAKLIKEEEYLKGNLIRTRKIDYTSKCNDNFNEFRGVIYENKKTTHNDYQIKLRESSTLINNYYKLTKDSIVVRKELLDGATMIFLKKLNEIEKQKLLLKINAIKVTELVNDYVNNTATNSDLEFDWSIIIGMDEKKIHIYKVKVDVLFNVVTYLNEILPEEFECGYDELYIE